MEMRLNYHEIQDVFIAVSGVRAVQIENLKAFLSKMVTNRCLNELKSAKKKRETYLGP